MEKCLPHTFDLPCKAKSQMTSYLGVLVVSCPADKVMNCYKVKKAWWYLTQD